MSLRADADCDDRSDQEGQARSSPDLAISGVGPSTGETHPGINGGCLAWWECGVNRRPDPLPPGGNSVIVCIV